MPAPDNQFEAKVAADGGFPLSSADRAKTGARDAGANDGLTAVQRRALTPPVEESPGATEVPDQ